MSKPEDDLIIQDPVAAIDPIEDARVYAETILDEDFVSELKQLTAALIPLQPVDPYQEERRKVELKILAIRQRLQAITGRMF